MRTNHIILFEKLANAFEIVAIVGILLIALFLEIVFHELPCPLCLLQRVGFYFMLFGFLLNMRFGFRPSHYSIVILGGLYTIFVAMRQIALHIIPGTGAYGNPILGFHLYTWVFIITMTITVITTLLFGIDRQYHGILRNKNSAILMHILFALVVLSLLFNIISVIFECGFAICPDNPTQWTY